MYSVHTHTIQKAKNIALHFFHIPFHTVKSFFVVVFIVFLSKYIFE